MATNAVNSTPGERGTKSKTGQISDLKGVMENLAEADMKTKRYFVEIGGENEVFRAIQEGEENPDSEVIHVMYSGDKGVYTVTNTHYKGKTVDLHIGYKKVKDKKIPEKVSFDKK